MESFYPERLLELKNNFSVKIIVGVRGVGKTTLLEDFTERLRSDDVATEEIIYFNCAADCSLRNFQRLYDLVAAKTSELEKFFLFLDDIDCVEEAEKTINAMFVGMPAEIYVTCSSERLAEKISVLLPDNCDVLKMYPPSFAEFIKIDSSEGVLLDYLHFGGLLRISDVDKKIFPSLLRGAAYEIMFDIVEKNSLQKAELLRLLIKALAQNVGAAANLSKIQDSLNCSGKAFRNYLDCAEELFIRIPRFDIKAGNSLLGGEKFYCVDNGILSALADVDETALMENTVCIELLRRGYSVSCGKFGTMNVSFVAERDGKKTYIQVLPANGAVSVRRSTRPLRAIEDDAERFLITLKPEKAFAGVQNVTLQDFLLE